MILSSMVSSYMLYAVISSYIYIVHFKLSIYEFMIYQTLPLLSQASAVLSYNLFKQVDLKKMIRIGIYLAAIVNILSILVFFGIIPYTPEIVLVCMMITCFALGIIFPAAMQFALDIFSSIKGTASSTLVVSRGICSGIAMLVAGYFHEYEMILFVSLIITSILAIISWSFTRGR